MVVMLHGLVEKYIHVCDQILGSLLYPILPLLVPPFRMCLVNLSLIHLSMPMIPLLWYLSVMIATAHASCRKGITSVIWQVRPQN